MKKTFRSITSLFLALVLIFSAVTMNVNAAETSGTCGENLTWTFNELTSELVISGTGEMTDWSSSLNAPWYSKLLYIKTVTLENGVTSIGDCAFYDCGGITSVTIPDSVTSIGVSAFFWCYNLTSVTIPDGVTSIGDSAFYGCNSLTSITIPDSVTSIGDCMLGSCGHLMSIAVDSANIKYSSDEYGVLFNKDKTELIQYPCGNTRTSYEIPDSVTSIGDHAFYFCNSLTSVTIPDSVTSVGDYAFAGCIGFTSITIPDSVTSIGDYAFEYCGRLISVIIPDSVTSIGDYAFLECKSLTSIAVDSANIKFSSDENGVLFNKDKTELIQYPYGNTRTSYEIPDSVASIGDYAFYDCDSLTSVTIPDGVISIGNDAFCGCDSLTSVTIGNNVTSIGDYAFCECNSLSDVYYEGTEEEWRAVTIDENNEPLLDAEIHYNYQTEEPSTKPETPTDIPEEPSTTKPTEPATKPEETEPSTSKPTEPVTKPEETEPSTTKPTEPVTKPEETEPSTTKPTEPATKPSVPDEPETDEAVIPQPKVSEISYGDKIVLSVDPAKIPQGGRVEWNADNNHFDYTVGDDFSCAIDPVSSGETTFTATVYDAEGNAVSTDEQTLTAKAGFFQKIIGFFKKLFNLSKVYTNI